MKNWLIGLSIVCVVTLVGTPGRGEVLSRFGGMLRGGLRQPVVVEAAPLNEALQEAPAAQQDTEAAAVQDAAPAEAAPQDARYPVSTHATANGGGLSHHAHQHYDHWLNCCEPPPHCAYQLWSGYCAERRQHCFQPKCNPRAKSGCDRAGRSLGRSKCRTSCDECAGRARHRCRAQQCDCHCHHGGQPKLIESEHGESADSGVEIPKPELTLEPGQDRAALRDLLPRRLNQLLVKWAM